VTFRGRPPNGQPPRGGEGTRHGASRRGAPTALTTLALAALAAAAIVVPSRRRLAGRLQRPGADGHRRAQRDPVDVSGTGNLEPANQTDVDFATSGEITHIYVKEGQHVSKDDILAKVDPASQRRSRPGRGRPAVRPGRARQAETPATTTAQSGGSKGTSSGSSSPRGATSR
jgi:multidrug efflux pump subunit AcrA (membrane-fusion protein)